MTLYISYLDTIAPLGIILILDSCHVTWSTTYIPNGYPNYSPGQYLSSEQKPLFQ